MNVLDDSEKQIRIQSIHFVTIDYRLLRMTIAQAYSPNNSITVFFFFSFFFCEFFSRSVVHTFTRSYPNRYIITRNAVKTCYDSTRSHRRFHFPSLYQSYVQRYGTSGISEVKSRPDNP